MGCSDRLRGDRGDEPVTNEGGDRGAVRAVAELEDHDRFDGLGRTAGPQDHTTMVAVGRY